MNDIVSHINQEEQDIDKLLHDFMGFMNNEFQKSAHEAKEGQSMLELGVKTEFAQKREKFILNPIDSMYKTRLQIDGSLKQILNAMVSAFLEMKANLISKAFAVEATNNNLYYCISLKEDNIENRIEINDFFDFYEDYSLSAHYPVYFQFVPDELMNKIKSQKEIVK